MVLLVEVAPRRTKRNLCRSASEWSRVKSCTLYVVTDGCSIHMWCSMVLPPTTFWNMYCKVQHTIIKLARHKGTNADAHTNLDEFRSVSTSLGAIDDQVVLSRQAQRRVGRRLDRRRYGHHARRRRRLQVRSARTLEICRRARDRRRR